MATAGFAQQVTRRRRWIAGVLAGGLALTVVTIIVSYWRSGARQEKAPPPKPLPTNVQQQLSGYSFTRAVGVRRVFTVHAARTVAFKEGNETVLEDVVVEVFGREGNRHDFLRTRRCEYNTRSGDLFNSGKVEIELNAAPGARAGAGSQPDRAATQSRAPVLLETSKIFFRQQGSRVVTREPVQFTAGPASGTARGLEYATEEGWLELKRDVRVELRPRGATRAVADAEPVRLTASRLRYESKQPDGGVVKISGPVEIVQGHRRLQAKSGTAWLDSRNRLTRAILEENVHASEATAAEALEGHAQLMQAEFDLATGELRVLSAAGRVIVESRRAGPRASSTRVEADRAEVNFRGTHPRPQNGNASGRVLLILGSSLKAAAPSEPNVHLPGEKETLEASRVEFTFGPDGKSLAKMQTIGPGRLVVDPADPKLGQREITAGEIRMAFDTRGRLDNLLGSSPTRIVFHPAPGAPPGSVSQVSSADQLEAKFDPASQTLVRAEQSGNFLFQDGDRQVTAERGNYWAAQQVSELTGRPEVTDPNTQMTAERLNIDLRTDTAEGLQKVVSTHFQRKDDAAAGAGRGENDDPTHVLADRMVAQRRTQFVHYEGHVRAWHGSDVVEASSLDVSRVDRQVRSGLGVLSSHFQPATLIRGSGADAPPLRPTSRVTIRADYLDFFDVGRKAEYRGKVELRTENTTLDADHMEVFFPGTGPAGASEIQRAVADGHVTVVQPGRRATGERCEYEAAPGKIVLTGGPPTLFDAQKGTTTGERLTFFVHDDRLLVDGGHESPALSQHRVAQ